MSLFRIWQHVPVVAIHSAIIRRYFATRTKTIRRFTVCLFLNSLEVGCNYRAMRFRHFSTSSIPQPSDIGRVRYGILRGLFERGELLVLEREKVSNKPRVCS